MRYKEGKKELGNLIVETLSEREGGGGWEINKENELFLITIM